MSLKLILYKLLNRHLKLNVPCLVYFDCKHKSSLKRSNNNNDNNNRVYLKKTPVQKALS